MKKEDLRHLESKDITEVINFADKLFKKSLEGKKRHIISIIFVWNNFQMSTHINTQNLEVI